MKIVSIGGGPGGLYFALLMKRQDPSHDITVIERNRADDTFGWGVVFSDETLGHFEKADSDSYGQIIDQFINWQDIDTYYRDKCVRSTGHGFCGMSRKTLLNILQDRCKELGVNLLFEKEVSDLEEFADADLILAADGVNSVIREQNSAHFKPTTEWGKCKFCWLGTTLPLDAFTFIFRENEHGLFQVHAYPFQEGTSTFIVECHEETWKKAKLDEATEADTVAYCENLFKTDLKGHKLLTNRSLWRSFPVISNEKWRHNNIVLLGDSAHTAHFSIGSGTKLAMEDALALADSFREHGTSNIERVLTAYENSRRVNVAKIQRAAKVSQQWFENSMRFCDQDPVQFTFNLMTRSKKITFDNLKLRDPGFVKTVTDNYAQSVNAAPSSDGTTPVPAFTPYQLREMKLINRVVVSPMCQYSAEDGTPDDWHLVHLGSRAIGGAGLVITEMTNVSRDARISPGCTGIYKPEHVQAWKRITDFVHTHSKAKIGIQLGHAGRKGSTRLAWEGMDEPLEEGAWPILSASPLPYFPHSPIPKEMDRVDMDATREEFVNATQMAQEADFDMVEIHMAHGYLLASFISPLTNIRKDEYGGSIENRMRFPLEIFDAVRSTWPTKKPISVRISATDWVKNGGLSESDSVEIAKLLKSHDCDIIDVSTGQTTPDAEPLYGRMFQVPYSDKIRHEAKIPTMTVGNVQGVDHANTILASGRADLCVMARPHLKNPYLMLHAAETYEYFDQHWPNPYLAVKPERKDP